MTGLILRRLRNSSALDAIYSDIESDLAMTEYNMEINGRFYSSR